MSAPAINPTDATFDATTTATAPAPPLPLRRNRDFQLLWSGRAVAGLGQEVAGIAYPLLMLAVTGSAGYAGLLATAQLVTAVIATLPAGLLADRVNRRRIMIGTDAARAVLLGGQAYAVYAGFATIPLIVGSAILASLCGALFNPAATAAVKQLVPASQMAAAQSQNEARMRGAALAGPPLGGWLFALGRGLPFLLDAVTYVIAATALLFVRKPLQAPRTPSPDREPPWRGLTAGLRYVFADAMLRNLLLWAMGVNLAFSGFGLILVATWRERGASDSAVGLLTALATAGGLLGALLAPFIMRRVSPSRLVHGFAWGFPAILGAMALLPGVVPLAIASGVMGLILPSLNALAFTYITAGTPDELQGRVGAGTGFLTMLLQPIGPVAVGTVFDASGTGAAFGLMAAAALLAAVFTLARPLRTLPRPEHLATA